MAGGLRIQLLGPFGVWVDGQVLSPAAWPGRKACQLLKILVTCRHRAVATDELIEWLWPDLTPASARNSLWVAVSRLRHLLEPEGEPGASSVILTQPPGYRFGPASPCEIDVDGFLAHIQAGQARQRQGELAGAIDAFRAAEELYRGDFLCEDPYEEWAIPERERLTEAFLDTEEALAACLLALGRCEEALVCARQALAQDPCRETAWRLAMEAQYRAGDPALALKTFARCRTILADELGVDPQAETLALHTRILRHSAPLPPPASQPCPAAPALHLPFVGRAREWLMLSEALARAMAGRGAMVLLAGQPGIGKTRLLEELAGLATARGAQVLAGRCYELEQNAAYAPIVEALRGHLPALSRSRPACPPAQLAALAALLPELREIWPDLPPRRPLPPDEERTCLLSAVAQVITGCALGEPVVLLLDDLQWADPSTLQTLHYLGRQVSAEPVLLVGAYRSTRVDPYHPLASLREQLAQSHHLTELTLPPFACADVALLLDLLGDVQDTAALAERLFRETEGHPYFLAEVLRTFVQEHLVAVDARGRWRLADGVRAHLDEAWPLPATVRAAVLGRLDRLALDDRRLLDQAAVVGGAFSLSLLARLLDQPEHALAERADRLSIKGFLQPRLPDSYEFGHELMRRAAYEALSEPRRRLLHRQTGEALAALDAPAGSVAAHYAASDRPWLALEPALAAAEQAGQVVAYEEASAWCRKALAIAEAHPAAAPPGFRTRLHLQERTLWYYRGDLERSLAAGRAALDAARSEGDAAIELEALWRLAHDETQVVAGGIAGLQARAVELAHTLGDPAAQARSLARLGSDTGFLAAPAERQASLDALDEALRLARGVGDPRLLHYVLCEFWGVGRLPAARTALEEALSLVRRLADPQEEVGTLAKLADLLTRQGDFSAAALYAREGLSLAEQVGNPAYGAWNRRSLGQALAAMGDADAGLAHLAQAAETFAVHAWRAMLAGALLRRGLVLNRLSKGGEAIRLLKEVIALSRETGEAYEEAYALAALGEAHLMLGATEAGSRDLEAAAALLPRVGLPWHRSGILLHLAAAHLLQGDAPAAQAALEEAVTLAKDEDLGEVRAQAHEMLGRALGQK